MTARTQLVQPYTAAPRAGSSSGPVAQLACSVGANPRLIGRYALFDEIAAGGMGAVYFGRQLGSAGFERVVAVKRAHRATAGDADFIAMFREEIRLLSRIRHQNVVAALDVVEDHGELLLVMEYVHGQALSALTRRARELGRAIPLEICVAVACGVLHGLDAAHTAQSSTGQALGIVHRDVSPQNVLVGCDGLSRVLDFGVAKAVSSGDRTRVGHVKGKLGYIAPEHILGKQLDCRADVYGLSVVLWEMLASTRLFGGGTDSDSIEATLAGKVPRLSTVSSRRIPGALEELVQRGLATDPAQRFASARDMATALQATLSPASAQDVGDWVTQIAHAALVERSRQLAWAENCPLDGPPEPESNHELVTQQYLDRLDDPSDLTVRDAPLGHDLSELEATLVRAPESDDWSEPATTFLARPAAARDERRLDTQPGQRVSRRSDRIRRAVLYVAALAAAASMANTLSRGALSAKLHGRVVPTADAALEPARVVAPRPAASATPAVAPAPPADRAPSPAVPIASLALEPHALAPRAQPAPRRAAPAALTPSRTLERPSVPVRVPASRKTHHLPDDGF